MGVANVMAMGIYAGQLSNLCQMMLGVSLKGRSMFDLIKQNKHGSNLLDGCGRETNSCLVKYELVQGVLTCALNVRNGSVQISLAICYQLANSVTVFRNNLWAILAVSVCLGLILGSQ